MINISISKNELGAKTINTSKQDLAAVLSENFGAVDYYGHSIPNVDAFAAGAAHLFEQVFNLAKPDARFAIVTVY